MEITITWYTDDLRSQVIDLFVKEYGLTEKSFSQLFEKFYLTGFQKEKCLLIVAMEGKTIAGFQSFFYWPYVYQGKTYHSFQSGNSLIHPAYRGKGIFNRMLAFLDAEARSKPDFLMGFPVEASLRNFIKDKWSNILDLRWYVNLCNPFGFLPFKGTRVLHKGHTALQSVADQNLIRLSNEPAFVAWREGYLSGRYFSFEYKTKEAHIVFHLKLNKRKKILNEAIIGNIVVSTDDAYAFLGPALRALQKACARSFGVHFISIAINDLCKRNLPTLLTAIGFRGTEKRIHFITKPFRDTTFLMQAENWLLYRSDIDTW